MDPNLREWIMDHSKALKVSNESEFEEYFSDRQGDLVDLNAIRRGVREPYLWNVCKFYGLEAFVPEFVDLYLNDLRNARRWDNTENIDTLLLDMMESNYKHKLATEWLVKLVQYGKRPFLQSKRLMAEQLMGEQLMSERSRGGRPMSEQLREGRTMVPYGDRSVTDMSHIETMDWKEIFAMAYTWSMELLMFALRNMEYDTELMTYIYHNAIERGLLNLMRFAHAKGANVIDGCNLAAKSGNVECLRLARQLGGSIGHSCEYAAANGHVKCLWLAYEMGSKIGNSCECAAKNGHAHCLCLAHELGGEIGNSCDLAAMYGHIECLRVAHQLSGRR